MTFLEKFEQPGMEAKLPWVMVLMKLEEADIIGQFGVGFYSAFMVADSVEVISKKVNSDKANKWSSNMDGYEIEPTKKDDFGTTIILHIKDNTKEKKYDKYLDSNEIQSLVKKYSDFIRYPIQMMVETYKQTDKEGKTGFDRGFFDRFCC